MGGPVGGGVDSKLVDRSIMDEGSDNSSGGSARCLIICGLFVLLAAILVVLFFVVIPAAKMPQGFNVLANFAETDQNTTFSLYPALGRIVTFDFEYKKDPTPDSEYRLYKADGEFKGVTQSIFPWSPTDSFDWVPLYSGDWDLTFSTMSVPVGTYPTAATDSDHSLEVVEKKFTVLALSDMVAFDEQFKESYSYKLTDSTITFPETLTSQTVRYSLPGFKTSTLDDEYLAQHDETVQAWGVRVGHKPFPDSPLPFEFTPLVRVQDMVATDVLISGLAFDTYEVKHEFYPVSAVDGPFSWTSGGDGPLAAAPGAKPVFPDFNMQSGAVTMEVDKPFVGFTAPAFTNSMDQDHVQTYAEPASPEPYFAIMPAGGVASVLDSIGGSVEHRPVYQKDREGDNVLQIGIGGTGHALLSLPGPNMDSANADGTTGQYVVEVDNAGDILRLTSVLRVNEQLDAMEGDFDTVTAIGTCDAAVLPIDYASRSLRGQVVVNAVAMSQIEGCSPKSYKDKELKEQGLYHAGDALSASDLEGVCQVAKDYLLVLDSATFAVTSVIDVAAAYLPATSVTPIVPGIFDTELGLRGPVYGTVGGTDYGRVAQDTLRINSVFYDPSDDCLFVSLPDYGDVVKVTQDGDLVYAMSDFAVHDDRPLPSTDSITNPVKSAFTFQRQGAPFFAAVSDTRGTSLTLWMALFESDGETSYVSLYAIDETHRSLVWMQGAVDSRSPLPECSTFTRAQILASGNLLAVCGCAGAKKGPGNYPKASTAAYEVNDTNLVVGYYLADDAASFFAKVPSTYVGDRYHATERTLTHTAAQYNI
ncbi:hypothetical protein KIPB_001766 [Kipferlia bialata]|uniref:Uncharacterized protein n=1 Tax=Kipferlia bialata TaxID=797122 RepID=A0A9K3GG64_9EUKA|nr:hypothetical protein KIPB_001766 [Kipferlia bialata]|eukprot:g1766.t1